MPDQNIALGVQVPDAMKNISGMLNFAGQAQNLQRGNIQLQKEQQANTERLAVQKFMSDPENFQTNGRIDMDKINKNIPGIAPLTGADVISKLSTLSSAQTAASEAKQKLTQSQREIIAGPIGVLGRAGVSDPAAYMREFESLKKQNPDNPELHRLVDAYSQVLSMTPAGDHLPKAAITASQSLMTPGAQQTSLSPTAGLTNTGGQIAETISQPAVGGNQPSVSLTGRAQNLTLPPTTTRFNSATNASETIGNAPGGGTVQTSAPLGKPETAAGVASAATTDWKGVQEAAKTASQDIGVLQEIKKYAHGAVTGVESERRAYVTGLSGLLGMSPEQLAKTDTDLLAKNSNMLALAGGDTNLAKTMAESANPNTHMTPEAIEKAANQVIGQRKLALARQSFLQNFIGDAEQYSRKKAEFDQIADPRILQLPTLSTVEKVAMKKAMSPTEQKEFGEKIKKMQALGILQ